METRLSCNDQNMKNKTGTVHFTLGENFGKLLTEIAIEKLYDFNISEALDVFSKSLGCSVDISEELLLGNYILVVSDSESCECKAIPLESYNGDSYPTLEFKLLQDKVLNLLISPEDNIIKFAKDRLEYNGLLKISNDGLFLRYRKIVESILHNDEDILDLVEIENPGEDFELFYKTVETFRKIRNLVSKRGEIIKIAEFIENNWKFHNDKLKERVENNISVILDFLIDIANI